MNLDHKSNQVKEFKTFQISVDGQVKFLPTPRACGVIYATSGKSKQMLLDRPTKASQAAANSKKTTFQTKPVG